MLKFTLSGSVAIILLPSVPDSGSSFDISLREVAAESVSIHFEVLLSSATSMLGCNEITTNY